MQFAVNSRTSPHGVKESLELAGGVNKSAAGSNRVSICETTKNSPRSSTDECTSVGLVSSKRASESAGGGVVSIKREGFLDDGRLDEIIRSVVGGSLPYGGTTKEDVVHVKELPRLSNVSGDNELHGKVNETTANDLIYFKK